MQGEPSGSHKNDLIPESALGPYGDVPVGYAIFRVIPDMQAGQAADVQFVHANSLYCEWSGHDFESLNGRSLAEFDSSAREIWFPRYYRCAVLGEKPYGSIFNAAWNHWVSFSIVPSSIEGCCIAAFTLSDEEHLEQNEIIESRDTADMIIDITEVFNNELDYETAIYSLLKMVSNVLNPDRLVIIERGETTSSCTFELCAEGIPSRIDSIKNIPNEQFDAMGSLAEGSSRVMSSEVANLKNTSNQMYRNLDRGGVNRMMGALLVHNGEDIGYLAAHNYKLEKGIDAKRVLDTVAPFVSARIMNQRLLDRLEYSSTHDALTDVLNRHGIDIAINDYLDSHPNASFALALIDIDDFKAVNDKHGHDVGDNALRTLSSKLVESFANDAVIGRNGGDEFLVALPISNAEDAVRMFDEFSASDFSFSCNGQTYGISISVGYTLYPAQATSLHEAYVHADAAMYEAKRAGKNCVRQFQTEELA